MRTVIDALGREVTYDFPPQKMISFDPAITETLYALDLEEQIAGRTRFCKHPADKVGKSMNVGGTKDMKLDRIHNIRPDLIICEKEENTPEMVETLSKYYPVYVCEVQTVKDGMAFITELGDLTGRSALAEEMKANVTKAFAALPKANGERIAYMIWQNPYMCAGRDTYITDLLETLGFVNAFSNHKDRYPVLEEADLQAADLDYILLATEPFPFKEKNFTTFTSFLPEVKPVIIDGEMFWYGVRMITAANYFQSFLEKFHHPNER